MRKAICSITDLDQRFFGAFFQKRTACAGGWRGGRAAPRAGKTALLFKKEAKTFIPYPRRRRPE
jgi:hypothetical protein